MAHLVTDFRKQHSRTEAHVESDTTAEVVANDIAESLKRAASFRMRLGDIRAKLSRSVSAAQQQFDSTSKGQLIDETIIRAVLGELRDALGEASTAITQVEAYLAELETVEKKARVVTEQIVALRQQIRQTHEVIGLGARPSNQ
jgi:uncharacterized coiled-coil DUF342 family protein